MMRDIKPTVFGVGINDMKGVISTSDKIYTLWYSMIRRCYSSVYHKGKPSYIGVEVCDKWKRLSGFSEDVVNLPNYVECLSSGYELDKDILSTDGKVYSPDTCCFIPKRLNGFFSYSGKRDKSTPKGVYFNSRLGKYVTSYTKDGVRAKHLGVFDNIEDARNAYLIEKRNALNIILSEYKDVLHDKVYNVLVNFDFDNT